MINFVFILPSLLLAILLMSFSGQSMIGLIIVLVFTGWRSYAKTSERRNEKNYGLVLLLEGAKALGASKVRILLKIILA